MVLFILDFGSLCVDRLELKCSLFLQGQSTRLFESTITQRRKNFLSKDRVLSRATNFSNNLKSIVGNKTPSSTQLTSDNAASESSSEEKLMLVTRESVNKLTVLEKVWRFLK